MNPTKSLVALGILSILGLAPASVDGSEESDATDKVRVVVVVDMTKEGRKVAPPTPEKPTYYLPISVGYKNFGAAHHFQRPLPDSWEIAHEIAKALYNQNYVLMTKQGHPSQVLYFWWGYMAPEDVAVGRDEGNLAKPGAIPSSGGPLWGPGQGRAQGNGYSITGPGDNAVVPAFSLGTQNLDERQMLSLVAGNTVDDHQKYPDPRLDEVVQMTTAPRYYVMISAFDFQAWKQHKAVLLWRAHISTEMWGRYFDQVASSLINAAAPFFGRETTVPQFVAATALPIGRVIVGTPEVRK